MRVNYYSALELKDIFHSFTFTLNEKDVETVKCIAYEGVTSDEVFAIYQVRLKTTGHRFFGVIKDDQHSDEQVNRAYMLERSKAKDATVIEHSGGNYLFELQEPFGIRLSLPKA